MVRNRFVAASMVILRWSEQICSSGYLLSLSCFSVGHDEVSFVADNGQELFNHSYGNIMQCCIAVDGISFAYAVRQEKDKYFCHVFQALTYEEVSH